MSAEKSAAMLKAAAAAADRLRELVRPMKENSIWRAVREGRPALGTGLKEFASRGVPWLFAAGRRAEL
jgi:hypothetical protein